LISPYLLSDLENRRNRMRRIGSSYLPKRIVGEVVGGVTIVSWVNLSPRSNRELGARRWSRGSGTVYDVEEE
jgi:hypothetical protein